MVLYTLSSLEPIFSFNYTIIYQGSICIRDVRPSRIFPFFNIFINRYLHKSSCIILIVSIYKHIIFVVRTIWNVNTTIRSVTISFMPTFTILNRQWLLDKGKGRSKHFINAIEFGWLCCSLGNTFRCSNSFNKEKAICSEKFSRDNTMTGTACKQNYYSHTHVFCPPSMNCAKMQI